MNRVRKRIVCAAISLFLFALALHSPFARAQTTDSKSTYGISIVYLLQAERSYDVVVAGGSAGGFAAALQARRMGATVAILGEANAIGGQLLTVSTIDEGWMSRNFPSGIYAELVTRLNQIYAAKGMSVGGCYWDVAARCYEPHVVNLQLTALLKEAGVDVYLRAKVKDVILDGPVVRGVEFQDPSGSFRIFASKVLIDATEYGDVIPLTGAAHLVANGTGDAPGTCIQNITYAVPIKYYDVVPASLQLPSAPPRYDSYKPEFEATIAASASNSMNAYPLNLLNHNIYRAMPDLNRGLSTLAGPPKSNINFANDYLDRYTYVKSKMPPQYFHMALDTRFLTDPATRTKAISEAKLKTLAFLYYMQEPQGLNDQHWAIADDEFGGITTPDDYSADIPSPFKNVEALMPPFPYVRESRRIQAVTMLTAEGIRRTPGSDGLSRGPLLPSGVAFGDYSADFHNCNWDGTFEAWANEGQGDLSMAQGPFQVPFGAFIPAAVDGFLVAEKNLGYSRVASSALRLQPSVLSTGQAAGMIAALAVQSRIQPRAVNPLDVQVELTKAGARISLYAHDDVPAGSASWADVQVTAARGIMIGTSPSHFSATDTITRREAAVVLARTLGYTPVGVPLPVIAIPTFTDVTIGDWGLPFVEAIAAHGITSGCSVQPRKFCPDEPMSREQFATFLVHGTGLTLGPAGGTGMFSDVTNGFQTYVEAAVRAGLMDPCGLGHFCGSAPAKRAADVAHGVVKTLSYTAH